MSLCKLFFSLFRCSFSLARLWLLESRNAKWTLGLGSPSWVSRERRRFLLSDRSSSLWAVSVSDFNIRRKNVSQKFLSQKYFSNSLLLTPTWTFKELQNQNCSISSHHRRIQTVETLIILGLRSKYGNVSPWYLPSSLNLNILCNLANAQLLLMSEQYEGHSNPSSSDCKICGCTDQWVNVFVHSVLSGFQSEFLMVADNWIYNILAAWFARSTSQ